MRPKTEGLSVNLYGLKQMHTLGPGPFPYRSFGDVLPPVAGVS
ncbi:hypothetical protein [Deinococcus sp. Arct2-2]|nr:hypothetical protein [Deinococcus sp. Arct2-2]